MRATEGRRRKRGEREGEVSGEDKKKGESGGKKSREMQSKGRKRVGKEERKEEKEVEKEGGRRRKMEKWRRRAGDRKSERVSGRIKNEGVLSDSEHTVDESFERSRKLRSISAVRACSPLRDRRG